jgi:hypothetical protein
MTRVKIYLLGRAELCRTDTSPFQMRTITYNDEAAPGAKIITSWEPVDPPQVITANISVTQN